MPTRKTESRPQTHASAPTPPPATTPERELQVEELEERITPRLAANHNETLLVD